MTRLRVAVLRGGPSEEYDISLDTGEAVLNSLDRDFFEPVDIIITKSGEWLHQGVARRPEHILQSVDAVFIALHGQFGEDGNMGVPTTCRTPFRRWLS